MQQIKKGFTLRKNKGVSYLTIPSFEQAGGVTCAFSTRIGGISPAPFDTLNFSRKREQSPSNFSDNFKRYAAAVGFDANRAAGINYAHSAAVYQVKKSDAGRGITDEALPQVCDGLYTLEKDLPLVSFHADCVPLYFYDPKLRAVAVCHAGWRGVAAHMVRHAVHALAQLGSSPHDILAAVGPCISVKHFEVGEEVSSVFDQKFDSVVQKRGGRLYVDLNKACVGDMLVAGLEPAHITDAAICTYEDAALFYSHRRDHGRTGAMAAVIALKEHE